VAALRGRQEAAIEAYGEAATIAPDRALPHASIGGILLKLGRVDDATAAFERALALAPRDEGALRGLADVLLRAGLRSEAAAALDRLADALDAAGRLADATDTARRALEVARSPERRARVEAFAARLRATSPGDEAALRALDQALQVLEPAATPELPEPESVPAMDGQLAAELESARSEATADAVEETALEQPGETPSDAPRDGVTEGAEAGEPDEPAPPGDPAQPPGDSAQPNDAAEPVEPIGLGIALGAAAEAALHAGDLAAAHDGLLAAARAHRRAGRLSAAVDACYLAIGNAPADPDLHILLAELYLDRGWRGQAIEKLLLLGRLADLDENRAVRDRLCGLVTDRLSDEPRVADLCA
jgi:tetratricopeptide (TPR) repeat protein